MRRCWNYRIFFFSLFRYFLLFTYLLFFQYLIPVPINFSGKRNGTINIKVRQLYCRLFLIHFFYFVYIILFCNAEKKNHDAFRYIYYRFSICMKRNVRKQEGIGMESGFIYSRFQPRTKEHIFTTFFFTNIQNW